MKLWAQWKCRPARLSRPKPLQPSPAQMFDCLSKNRIETFHFTKHFVLENMSSLRFLLSLRFEISNIGLGRRGILRANRSNGALCISMEKRKHLWSLEPWKKFKVCLKIRLWFETEPEPFSEPLESTFKCGFDLERSLMPLCGTNHPEALLAPVRFSFSSFFSFALRGNKKTKSLAKRNKPAEFPYEALPFCPSPPP